MLAVPVSPNDESLFFAARTADTPKPSDIMNGTVIGPVVAPPESKAMGQKFDGAKKASAKSKV